MPTSIVALSDRNSNACVATSHASPWEYTRLRPAPAGKIILSTQYRDGAAYLVRSPLESHQCVAAYFAWRWSPSFPGTRLHLICFYGVRAPNAALCSQIIPDAQALHAASGERDVSSASPRAQMGFGAQLLERLCAIDSPMALVPEDVDPFRRDRRS